MATASTRKSLSAKDRLILAVDTSTVDGARRVIDELHEYVGVFKIGLELFMNAGPSVLELFQQAGLNVFFDGKFLDIPNTVAKATEAVAKQGVQMFTVHATGGSKMLRACADAARTAAQAAGKEPPISLGVTVLTSLSPQALSDELSVGRAMSNQVVHLAQLCRDNGITGIVSSAHEVAQLRAALGDSMVLVTPGVRPVWADANDQSRIVTPAEALGNGADYLVIGRPILGADDKKDAAKRILNEMDAALAKR